LERDSSGGKDVPARSWVGLDFGLDTLVGSVYSCLYMQEESLTGEGRRGCGGGGSGVFSSPAAGGFYI
jgi:hypothetical protein